jgi:acetylornithine/N-succinyldiaminopimelate aminotransferase
MKTFNVYPLLDVEPVKASGCWLWDKDGNKYLDLYGGHAVISIGHTHTHYIKKIEEQLEKIGFYSNSVRISIQDELAKKLGELSGYNDYNLFLCNSGAEANENALKLASFHNRRKKIIAFSKAFHGRTSLAVAATDNKAIVAPVNETENVIFLPFNDEAALENAMNDSICAVIIEGMQGVGGVQVPTDLFLQKAKALCEKYNAVLILDEVQSGYGRSGKFFSHQFAGIKPDIITTAKGMGNGFPIGGVLISPKFAEKHHMLGTTFGGNHLACAAAIAVLEVIKNENLMMNAKAIGDYMMSVLKKITGVKEVRGRGLMIGVELEFPYEQVRNELIFTHRIFTGTAGKNIIRLLPPLTLSKEEAEIFLHAFAAVMKKSLVK